MRGISFTALLISNLAYWAILALTVAIATITAFVVALVADVDTLPQTLEALKSSEAFDLLNRYLSCTTAAVGGGFVAARLGRERPQLQAALALSSSVALYIFDLGHGPVLHNDADLDVPVVSTFATVYLLVGPLLAMLGGYLAQRHQARLDAMSPQERGARTPKAAAVAVLRWTLAFPAATAAFALSAALAHLLIPFIPFAPFAFAFGVITGILAGTLVAPPAHRTFAGFLLIGLTLLIPVEEIARHVWFDGQTVAYTGPILLNTVAAGFAYIGLRKAFPRSFASHPGRWWWILDLDLDRWSPEERAARRGLAAAAGLIWIALFLSACAVLDGQGFHLVLAAVATLPMALMAARPVFARMAPDLLWRADQNAVVRLATRGATPTE
jgi:hypothetical protein